jgi:hypothetical protein
VQWSPRSRSTRGPFSTTPLKLDGKPRPYVEAEGPNENLDDKNFIAQTVNYAKNDGVVWCVLTNGSRIRVYRTNEPVAMDRKLLFEIDLADASETHGDKTKLLRLISGEAVQGGDLDRFGERVFTGAASARRSRTSPATRRRHSWTRSHIDSATLGYRSRACGGVSRESLTPRSRRLGLQARRRRPNRCLRRPARRRLPRARSTTLIITSGTRAHSSRNCSAR